jgi:phosphate transport system permease protein
VGWREHGQGGKMDTMTTTTLMLILAGLGVFAYAVGRSRAVALARGPGGTRAKMHSLPEYYGYHCVLWSTVPALLLLFVWELSEANIVLGMIAAGLPVEYASLTEGQLELFLNTVRNEALTPGFGSNDPAIVDAARQYRDTLTMSHWFLAAGTAVLALGGLWMSLRSIHPDFRARNRVESAVEWFLFAASSIAILTTVGIVLSILSEALRFFEQVSLADFMFGTTWSPQTAIREDQIGASGSFGMAPLLVGTFLITLIAILLAVPVGLLSSIYLAEYASRKTRAVVRPLLEVLAGIPTVVYGFFAVLVVAPWVRSAGAAVGLDVAAESALAAGIVMGIMIIPLISSLSDDAIRAVPAVIREGALALGATRSEAITTVILPAAMPGILGGVLLAVSRAIGETMIVVMAASLAANLTVNPLEAVTTVTVQIVTLLVGDQEFDSARTLAAFALGLMLFVITTLLNVIGLNFVRRYQDKNA